MYSTNKARPVIQKGSIDWMVFFFAQVYFFSSSLSFNSTYSVVWAVKKNPTMHLSFSDKFT